MRRIVLLFGVLLALAIAAPAPTWAQATTASVRVMHAAAGAPNVDIYIDDVRVSADTPFFTLSERQAVEGGEHRLRVVPAGFEPSEAVIDQQIELDTNQGYLLAVVEAPGGLALELLDDNVDEARDRFARVRVLHLATGAAAVDIKQTEGSYLLTDQYYGSDDYLDLLPGSYGFDILASEGEALLTRTGELRFEGGWNYDIIVTDSATAEGTIQTHVIVDRTDEEE